MGLPSLITEEAPIAVATRPLTFARAVVGAPGTSVAASAPVPDNCRSLVLLNVGANIALVGVGVPGPALVDGSTAIQIPVGRSLTIPLGSTEARGIMDQAQLAGSGLVFDALGGATTVDVMYKNRVGS